MTIPLPKSVQTHCGENTHPGLLVDKYVDSFVEGKWSERVQKPTLEKLVTLSKLEPLNLQFRNLRARHSKALKDFGAKSFEGKTTGPLAIHLARGSALENAGICLHPVHGFVYLPGSGLKGMARSFAETQWLDRQPDKCAAWRQIEDVFGWEKNGGQEKKWKPQNIPPRGKEEKESAGNVIFHDAWPTAWPKINIDVLSNHHTQYYNSNKNDNAPGDWEEPVPVYFPVIEAGHLFEFFISLRIERNPDKDHKLCQLAMEWLAGSLKIQGAGAKTSSGYGRIITDNSKLLPALSKTEKYEDYSTTLELVSPAFLAGALQTKDDCDLRPATMKGILRWWWRTMHSGFMDVPNLRELEGPLWGDTNQSGAIKISIQRTNLSVQQFSTNTVARENKLPAPRGNKTTMGLHYASYGMNEQKRPARYYALPGSKWELSIHCQSLDIRGQKISAQMVMDQAKLSLWWLCFLGGVGAKSRKGFGSLNILDGLAEIKGRQFNSEYCKKLREAAGMNQEFSERNAESPSLRLLTQIFSPEDRDGILTNHNEFDNPWITLDSIGMGVQRFAQQFQHKNEKKALGLPRISKGGSSGTFNCNLSRHASPVFFHCFKNEKGKIQVRFGAFPSPKLPDLQTSRKFLIKFLDQFSFE